MKHVQMFKCSKAELEMILADVNALQTSVML